MAFINNYTMPIFSKDYRGRERMPPLPVSFDRVKEDRSSESDTTLFKLPIEVLNLIIQHLASDSLASLALASRDCLQMARSRQFVSITLDYNFTGCQMVLKLLHEGQKLLHEGQQRLASAASTLPALGACIRHITVLSYSGSEESENAFTQGIQLLTKPTITPNLELLDWENEDYCLPRSFFTSLLFVSFWRS
ncbi:hypothetical protein G7Y79_00068g096200 [Physcia stellaris]|nr:hypothetical protein G7Y79_00068g096200 [Physcia stellaris]